jgi:hypothetical protein
MAEERTANRKVYCMGAKKFGLSRASLTQQWSQGKQLLVSTQKKARFSAWHRTCETGPAFPRIRQLPTDRWPTVKQQINKESCHVDGQPGCLGYFVGDWDSASDPGGAVSAHRRRLQQLSASVRACSDGIGFVSCERDAE